MKNWFTSFLIFNCLCLSLSGQKDTLNVKLDTTHVLQKTISKDDIAVFINDADFNYETAKSAAPDWWISLKNWIANSLLKIFKWFFGANKATGAFNMFLSILPYVLLILLLFILIKFFMNVQTRALVHHQKNTSIVDSSEEEQIIQNEDIETLIAKALSNEDYRLAIRYYYLLMLKKLNEKEIINWQTQKTNSDYKIEIGETVFKKPFSTITRLYEYIWYGDFPIDKDKYYKVEPHFLSLKKILEHG